MTRPALWKVMADGRPRLAVGPPGDGPNRLLATETTVDDVFAGRAEIGEVLESSPDRPMTDTDLVLAPLGSQDVWASGVTYPRSRDARKEESQLPDHYDRVYDAERPELFLKAVRGDVRGSGEAIGIRSDSTWNVPEAELALAVNADSRVFAYTIGNDVSSRSIEGANPLYLPQAKVYRWSCALGPSLVPLESAPPLEDLNISVSVQRDGQEAWTDHASVGTIRRSPDELVSWLTRAQDFPQGVVLLTGTPLVPEPSFTLRPGDHVTISITGLGELKNSVVQVESGVPPSEEEAHGGI